jgi:hypothetical protein
MFDRLKNTYNKISNFDKQMIENSTNPPIQSTRNDTYYRQNISIPQYDSRTLGIDVAPDIEKLKNFFRGRRLDNEGKKFIKFDGAQEIINEAGSEWLLSHHESMLSISNATTNLKDNNVILELCEEYANNLNEIVCSKYREWGIDPAFFDIIIDSLARNYQLFLLKSLDNQQRKLMLGASERPEPQQQFPFSA